MNRRRFLVTSAAAVAQVSGVARATESSTDARGSLRKAAADAWMWVCH